MEQRWEKYPLKERVKEAEPRHTATLSSDLMLLLVSFNSGFLNWFLYASVKRFTERMLIPGRMQNIRSTRLGRIIQFFHAV